jgi:hypothetical protein
VVDAGQQAKNEPIDEVVLFEKMNPAPYNPRLDLTPADPEYRKLEKSILKHGHLQPLVWNRRTGNLVGGHQTLKVLKAAGHKKAQTAVVDLDENEEKALNLALNKTGGRWNQAKLAELLSELKDQIEDMEETGFDEIEVDAIAGQAELDNVLSQFETEEEDEYGPPPDLDTISTRNYVVEVRFPDRTSSNKFIKWLGVDQEHRGRTIVIHERALPFLKEADHENTEG